MCWVIMGHLRVTIGHLRATLGHLKLTIGYLKATVVHVILNLQTDQLSNYLTDGHYDLLGCFRSHPNLSCQTIKITDCFIFQWKKYQLQKSEQWKGLGPFVIVYRHMSYVQNSRYQSVLIELLFATKNPWGTGCCLELTLQISMQYNTHTRICEQSAANE